MNFEPFSIVRPGSTGGASNRGDFPPNQPPPNPLPLPVPEIPVVVEVPHAGLWVPPEFLNRLVCPARSIGRDADLYVDELFADAPLLGATLLVAHVSRYVVDFNRAEDDVDSQTVVRERRAAKAATRGLIWKTTTAGEAAIDSPLSREEYKERVERLHRPYHQALMTLLAEKRAKFGYVVLLCGHSMPSLGRAGNPDAGLARADVVPGTRGRTSAAGSFIDAVDQKTRELGFNVEHDHPYRGGYSTGHYGRPHEGQHAIQLELARRLYMDELTLRRTAGFACTRALCRELIATVGAL